jgi:hypothetical protein
MPTQMQTLTNYDIAGRCKLLLTSPSVFRKNGIGKKVKIQFALEQAMKAQRGSRGIVLLFL